MLSLTNSGFGATWGIGGHPGTVELLYVDCKKSLLSMSTVTLRNITYDENQLDQLKSNPSHEVYSKKIMINNSPTESKSKIQFEIETFDNATMKLSRSHHSYFKTNDSTYREWGTRGKANPFWKFLGLKGSAKFLDQKWKSSESSSGNGNNIEIFQASARRERFKFSQEITIPAFSKSTVIAFSKPIRGKVPFTAVYELFPSGTHDVTTLEKALKKYGLNEKLVRLDQKTLLVSYDGLMDIDAGHEIDVDIQTVKLGTSTIF